MDDLDGAIKNISPGSPGEKELSGLLDNLRKKSQVVRKHIAGIDARIERTMTEWENLKKNEIGLSALENQIRSSLQES
jgi:archaellum component FlaC